MSIWQTVYEYSCVHMHKRRQYSFRLPIRAGSDVKFLCFISQREVARLHISPRDLTAGGTRAERSVTWTLWPPDIRHFPSTPSSVSPTRETTSQWTCASTIASVPIATTSLSSQRRHFSALKIQKWAFLIAPTSWFDYVVDELAAMFLKCTLHAMMTLRKTWWWFFYKSCDLYCYVYRHIIGLLHV